jgi:[FeFe] hydrogenase H-cluster maturation GTPase HydF
MNKAPKNSRLHIGIFGRRNTGKSSLLNALTGQQVSIVSEAKGTTTDPVEKPMELQPLGPVLFIDTAGIDDEGKVGQMRVAKTRAIFDRVDLCIIVAEPDVWGEFECRLLHEFKARAIPIVVVFNKADILVPTADILDKVTCLGIHAEVISAGTGAGLESLRKVLVTLASVGLENEARIVADMVPPGETCILVVPIDKEAPKGRLILPQVQTIRDLLDNDSIALVVKERELSAAFSILKKPPRLVVTDSQAFLKVASDTPDAIPMTSFSILYARFLGDLTTMVAGAMTIDALKAGDKILIAESCSHHPIADDIGTIKIPRWLTQYVGGKLSFEHVRGHDFPDNLKNFKLVVHCGACMNNRREMLSRIAKCKAADVPITNYGLTIAFSLGIFERALLPFPGALAVYRSKKEAAVRRRV